jgi:hypothetical protein
VFSLRGSTRKQVWRSRATGERSGHTPRALQAADTGPDPPDPWPITAWGCATSAQTGAPLSTPGAPGADQALLSATSSAAHRTAALLLPAGPGQSGVGPASGARGLAVPAADFVSGPEGRAFADGWRVPVP